MELTAADIAMLLPKRDENAHKGNFGRILLLCGSLGYTGAAYFAAMGALRTGAGLVYLGVPESIYAIEAGKLNEPVIFPLPDQGGRLDKSAIPEILERLPRMDAVLIGPGLGLGTGPEAVLTAVLTHAACPVVIDADGITLLVRHMDILRGRMAPTVLTPHDGEFARLFGPVGEDRMASARAAARDSRSIVLLKGHRTCITDGTRDYRNTTGNPGMANIMAQLGKGAGLLTLAGDTLKTVAACGAAYYATAPLIGQASILYAGLGAVLGHNYPAWAGFRGGKGVAVTCVWLVLYLPFWGTLCCIAGGALVLWLGYLPLGAVVIPALAILPAWLSYGPESGILTLALAIIMFSRHYHGLLRIRQGTEPRFFQRRNPK